MHAACASSCCVPHISHHFNDLKSDVVFACKVRSLCSTTLYGSSSCSHDLIGNRAAPQVLQLRQSVPFNGTVIDRHTTADEEYVHVLFGARDYGEGQNRNVVDAEFLFLKGVYQPIFHEAHATRLAHTHTKIGNVAVDIVQAQTSSTRNLTYCPIHMTDSGLSLLACCSIRIPHKCLPDRS